MFFRFLLLVKPLAIVIYRLIAPLLNALGVDMKGFYEFLFWQYQKQKEGELKNASYEEIYTRLVGLSIDYYADKKILDIGCGPRGSLEWATMAKERVGLDPLVNKYRQLGIDKHTMTYVNAGSENIPYDDGYFDVVMALNSLDHVDDLEKTLSEIKRVTNVDGEFLIMTHIHEKPTIAEPIAIPWNLTKMISDGFDVIEEQHYEVVEDRSVIRALRNKVPFDHSNPESRYGVLFARLRRI